MSLEKRFTKHGNSYALIIDKALIDLLGMNVEEPVEISTADGQSLIIQQRRLDARQAALRNSVENLHNKYGDVMKRLAE